MNKLIVALSFVSLLCCNSINCSDPYQSNTIYWMSAGFSQDDQKLLRESLEEWNKHLSKRIFVETTINPDWILLRSRSRRIVGSGAIIAITNMSDHTIIFYDDWAWRTDIGKNNVTRHEVGHVLGLDHVKNAKCLMFEFELMIDELAYKDWCI